MKPTKLAVAAAAVFAVTSLPALAKTRNEVLLEVEATCTGSPSACGAAIEAAMGELVANAFSLSSLATFSAKLVERATDAAVAGGASVENLRSVAESTVSSLGQVKEKAAEQGVFGVAARVDAAVATAVASVSKAAAVSGGNSVAAERAVSSVVAAAVGVMSPASAAVILSAAASGSIGAIAEAGSAAAASAVASTTTPASNPEPVLDASAN